MTGFRGGKFLSLIMSFALIAPQLSFAGGEFFKSGAAQGEAPPVAITAPDMPPLPIGQVAFGGETDGLGDAPALNPRADISLPEAALQETRPSAQTADPTNGVSIREISAKDTGPAQRMSQSFIKVAGQLPGAPIQQGRFSQEANTIGKTLRVMGSAKNTNIFDGSSQGSKKENVPTSLAKDEAAQREIMAAIADAAQRGAELESWGLPNSAPVTGHYLRYAKLYRMSGQATDLGIALHEALKPLVESDPKLMSRLSQNQLEEALSLAEMATRYSKNHNIPGLYAIHHSHHAKKSYDYWELREALLSRARDILAATPSHGEKSAGLISISEEKRPTQILAAILDEISQNLTALLNRAKAAGTQGTQNFKDEFVKTQRLLFAFAAATQTTLDMGNRKLTFAVLHKRIPLIVAELGRRKVESSVIEALVRSFPLGESLWRMGIPKLWEAGITGRGIKVAVIDNGVDSTHPDLQDAITQTTNFTRDRGDDTKGDHATPMADIIHAIAPEAEIMSYQALSNSDLPGVVLNQAETAQSFIQALEKAEKDGAQVINISAGLAIRGYSSDVIANKVDELSKKGVIVVVSAGNEGDSLPSGSQVRNPGTSKLAITVGAVDYHNAPADFSSSGIVFDPQTHSVEYKPDVHAFGVNIKAATQLPKELYAREPAPYNYISGTSPAAPHVSGVVALMLAAAKQAGIATTGGEVSAAAKIAVVDTAEHIGKIRVLLNTQETISAFIKLLS